MPSTVPIERIGLGHALDLEVDPQAGRLDVVLADDSLDLGVSVMVSVVTQDRSSVDGRHITRATASMWAGVGSVIGPPSGRFHPASVA